MRDNQDLEKDLSVVKVGGSLFDLPDLGRHLREGLARWGGAVLLVPGGGPTADVVRGLDRRHGLGEETAHWLALRALAVHAHFLKALLPGAVVVARPECPRQSGPAILDPLAFLEEDESRPGRLPASWEVTSDSVAARAAVVAGARRLVLLKSVALPAGLSWEEAAQRGLVDGWFARVLREAPADLSVCWENFRAGLTEPAGYTPRGLV